MAPVVLSQKQALVFAHILAHPEPHNPSDVAAALKLSSSGLADYTLARLVEKGLAVRLPAVKGQRVRYQVIPVANPSEMRVTVTKTPERPAAAAGSARAKPATRPATVHERIMAEFPVSLPDEGAKLCYTCRRAPAGNELAGPFSAYCRECQPWPG